MTTQKQTRVAVLLGSNRAGSLNRRIAEKRVYPAIDINRSGTRREDYLIEPELLQKIWILRKLLHGMDEIGAMEFLLDKMKNSKSNDEFFASMKR